MSAWQLCGDPSCDAMPLNEVGAPVAANVRRWWCEQHRDQAAAGDMEPPGSGVRISESGSLIPIDDHEGDRDAARAESRRAELESRLADAEVDAAAGRRHREAREQEVRRLLPPGVPG